MSCQYHSSVYHIYYCRTWSFFVPVLCNHHIFEWGLTVNQNQKKDYIGKQLQNDTSSIYEKSMRFLQLAMKLWHWTTHKGLYLQKKIVYTRLSLSLSLSPPLEERARGEVRGSWTLVNQVQPPKCHFWPMCSIPSWCTDHYF